MINYLYFKKTQRENIENILDYSNYAPSSQKFWIRHCSSRALRTAHFQRINASFLKFVFPCCMRPLTLSFGKG